MKKIVVIMLSLIFVFSLAGCQKEYEPEPQIKDGEFPFVVQYTLNGEKYLILDTVVCVWDGYDMSNGFPVIPYSRSWDARLKSGNESKRTLMEFDANSESKLVKGRINAESRLVLYYGSGGYYLGDPNDAQKHPCINYVEIYKISDAVSRTESTEISVEQLKNCFGLEITQFEFSNPIDNKFE